MQSKVPKFSSSIVVYGLGLGANRLISLLALPVFAIYFTPYVFGQIATLAVMAGLFRMAVSIGVMSSVGIVYFEETSATHRASVVGSAMSFFAGMSLLVLAALVFFSDTLALNYMGGENYAWFLLMQAGAASLLLISEPAMMRIQFEKQAVRYALVSVGVPLFGTAFTLILVAFYDLGLHGWAFGQLFTATLQVVVAVFLAVQAGGLKRGTVALIRKMVSLGMPLLPSFAFIYGLQYSGHYFLAKQTNLDTLGIYNVGFSFGMGMVLMVSAFNSAWYPFFQSHVKQQGDAASKFSQIARIYAATLSMLVLIIYICAQPIMVLITSPALSSGYKIVGPIALGQALLGYWAILLPGIYYEKKVYMISVLQGVASLITVGMTIALISLWGGEGAAYAMVGGCLCLILLQIAYNTKKNYVVCAYDWSSIGMIFVVLLVQIVFYRWIEENTSLLTTGGVGLGVLLLGGYIIWKILPIQDLNIITENLNRGRKFIIK